MLLAANEWGVPPWIVTGEAPGDMVRLKWLWRFRESLRLGGIRWGNKARGLGIG